MWFLAGSSKWILIFLIVLGAEYLSFVKSIALTFFGYIISVLASVTMKRLCKYSQFQT